MNIINKLEDLAHSLPCDSVKESNISAYYSEALSQGDGSKIKAFLSGDRMNADMTRVTSY